MLKLEKCAKVIIKVIARKCAKVIIKVIVRKCATNLEDMRKSARKCKKESLGNWSLKNNQNLEEKHSVLEH